MGTFGLSEGSTTHSRSRTRTSDPTAYTSEFDECTAEGSVVFQATQIVSARLPRLTVTKK
jgi:hypothetical protein